MSKNANPAFRVWEDFYGEGAAYRWLERRGQFRDDWHQARDKQIYNYCFSAPTDEALDAVTALGPIVELGAGTGFWARMLELNGADVLAFDKAPAGDPSNHWYKDTGRFFDVQIGDEQALSEHGDRALMLSWPPYLDRMAVDALKMHARAGGTRLAYIGEDYGGCCASDAFFGLLNKGWRETTTIPLPQWDGINDYLTLYERAS